ncbi:MAG TPA: sigma-54 dependent transcriptional regulator [Candidatus Acidoferrales bacterium]|jgi:DNA-binding NtrC family response regulator|nr:sigma-54 dependent transcriptional regulator [Candidatus Acidoferrales bacterium]
MTQVLVVDDEAAMRTALEANFRRDGWAVTTASGAAEAIAKFRGAPCPLVVTDMRMPDGDGLSVLQGVREIAPQTAVVFLTAFGSIPEAVLTMKEGACDYLVKPISFDSLKQAAHRVLENARRESAGEDREASEEPNEQFTGSSLAFRRMIDRARQAAASEADILIEAESGTGKEVLARFIHRSSPRRARTFVAVNCAAFPEALLESELFGHVRGAFTGASNTKLGKFELADGGTLLLDEIGEMPLSLQPKLLRVLQEREIDRLGDTRPVRVDVRVIATTNRSLKALVGEGRFRADLYYRLNVVPLSVPPLRDRREDIAELAKFFLLKYTPKSAPRQVSISPELLERLEAHDWPGNIRELENVIRRALALSAGPVLGPDAMEETKPRETAIATPAAEPSSPAAGTSMRDMERQLLEKTLESTGGNRTRAAMMLGISLRTIRNKIREYGLPPRRFA